MMSRSVLALGIMIIGLGFAIVRGASPAGQASVPLGLPAVPVPADNPMTPAKIALGKQLYFDPGFRSTTLCPAPPAMIRRRVGPTASRTPRESKVSAVAGTLPPC